MIWRTKLDNFVLGTNQSMTNDLPNELDRNHRRRDAVVQLICPRREARVPVDALVRSNTIIGMKRLTLAQLHQAHDD